MTPAPQIEDYPISLLVLQPSPFCNINCDYCYLPDRTSTKRMGMEVLAGIIRRVFESGLVSQQLSLVWHAGEPLAVPISWYEEAFRIIRENTPAGVNVVHSMQSNGTLINEAWCHFIKVHHVSIGLSIDGPASIHDAHRRTRQGQGTHDKAMRGLRLLQEHGIRFHVIAVITREAVDHAEEIYRFFFDLGISQLGFNVEEIEGENSKSSLEEMGSGEARVGAFMRKIFDLQKADQGRMIIREFAQAAAKITGMPSMRKMEFPFFNEQVRPFGILNIDYAGNFSVYSPELLGMPVAPYGTFSFGNILEEDFTQAANSPKFRQVFADIRRGLEICRNSCAHYGYCGGGSPGNKYYENGSFASGETMFCRCSVKLPLDLALEDMEKSLGLAKA